MTLSGDNKDSFKIAIKSDATVLINGPTGSGKTFLAAEIHKKGTRSNRPFIVVNLASLHEGTIESELFGHERGSFTGADQKRVGRLELADGGTVFLDEIGELSLRLQARLLEFIQSKTITPVGSNKERKLNVRIITATHKNLSLAVKRGEFREDLFHRLRVITFDLKPLAERWDEFDEIVHQCLAEICSAEGREVLRISEDFAAIMEAYNWPGNIRELRNVLEYAVLSSDNGEITQANLPAWFELPQSHSADSMELSATLGVAEFALSMDYERAISEFEREFLLRAIRKCRGRINRTAREIGINKTTLMRRLKDHGLTSEQAIFA
jgi:two-component system nitrogen regulation response regulator NtrX